MNYESGKLSNSKLKTQNSRLLTPEPRPLTPARAWLLRIVGTLFFAGLLVWLDLTGRLQVGEILSALRGANPALVVLSIALYVPFLAVPAAAMSRGSSRASSSGRRIAP